ncbi:UNVERIFIED_CONTAM: Peptidase M20 domain-containing protein 2 [Trichonephila clavipes]
MLQNTIFPILVPGNSPVVAIILEYDALPGIGHACGHNLIAEAGLAASLAIKEAMDADPKLEGKPKPGVWPVHELADQKLLVLGTPAEERIGGKIDLLEAGAFQGVDAALMVHPSKYTSTFPPVLSRLSVSSYARFPYTYINNCHSLFLQIFTLVNIEKLLEKGTVDHSILSKLSLVQLCHRFCNVYRQGRLKPWIN